MRVVSEETKRKMSEAQKRRWGANREAYLANLLETHVGAKRSKATREKMSATHKARYAQDPTALASIGEASRELWKQPGHRLKMALRRSGGFLKDDRGRIYADACEAAQTLGASRKRIYRALKEPFTADGQRRLVAGRALEWVPATAAPTEK